MLFNTPSQSVSPAWSGARLSLRQIGRGMAGLTRGNERLLFRPTRRVSKESA